MGLPSATNAATQASFGCPAGGRRRRGHPGCPDACHAVRRSVRVRCPAMRTDVRPTGSEWTSGVHASGVHASGVHAPGVHTTGVIRVSGRTPVRCPRVRCPCVRCPRAWCPHDRCDPGVRTDTRPVSAAAATPLDPDYSVRRDRPRLVHRVRRVAVVGERRGGRCPNRAWRARDGRTLAVRGSHEGRRQTWRCFAGVQAAAPRSPPGRPGELVQRQVPVGWRGEQGSSRRSQSPRRCVLGGLPACWPTMGWTGRC
jgi:hypothetical protein